jgi:hypothetical protein
MKFGLYNTFKSTPIIGKWLQKSLFNKLSVSYDILLNYLEAHEEAYSILDEVIDD